MPLQNINPTTTKAFSYDQFGVELGKELAKKLLNKE